MKIGMFIIGLTILATAFVIPVSQSDVNKNCIASGGYVSNYKGYIGCNIDK